MTLDPSTGAFIYTPSASARAAGGLDSFTVAVSDGRDVISVESPTWKTTTVTVPIRYVEHPSEQTTPPIEAGYGPTDVAVGGTRAYVAGTYDLTAIDTTTNRAVATAYLDGVAVGPVLATPNGNRVYMVEWSDIWNDPYSQVVIAYDGTTLARVGDPLAGYNSSGYNMAVSPDSTRLYVGLSSGTIVVVDTASNAAIDTIPVNAAGYLAVSADGKRLYAKT